jgi:integrase
MSVTKRGDKWHARWKIDGRHVSRAFDLKEDAVAWKTGARRRGQLGAHAPAEPSRDALASWLTRYWDRESTNWAQSTRMYRAHIIDKWVTPFIGGVRLRDLGNARVRTWLAEIVETGCTPGQRNHALRVLSAALGVAVQDGLIPANPCAGIRRAPHTPARPRALTPMEIEAIRAQMPTPRDALLVSILGYAGLRPEEVVPLRWSDVAAGVIVVDRAFTYGELKGTKTGARRAVEIAAPLADDLAAIRPAAPADGELIAPNRTGGFLDWRNWRNRVWNPACAAAGAKATPYDLRHSFASLLIHEGRNPLLVSAAMGHASGRLIWSTYGHVFDAARLAAAVPMIDAIRSARQELRKSCAERPERHLRLVS